LFATILEDLASLNQLYRAASEWTYIACEMASLPAGSFFTLNDNNDLGLHRGQ